MPVDPVPEGFPTVTPYLVARDADKLLAFLKQALLAEELECLRLPDGRIKHAQVRVGDSILMLGDPGEACPSMPACLYLYVPDVDAWYARARAAGGESLAEPTDQFYGDRTAGIADANGNHWWIATHTADVSPAAMQAHIESPGESA